MKFMSFILVLIFLLNDCAWSADVFSPIDEVRLPAWNYEGNLCDGMEALRLIGERALREKKRGGLIFEYGYNPDKSFVRIKISMGRCSLREALMETARQGKVKIVAP